MSTPDVEAAGKLTCAVPEDSKQPSAIKDDGEGWRFSVQQLTSNVQVQVICTDYVDTSCIRQSQRDTIDVILERSTTHCGTYCEARQKYGG